MPFFDFNKFCEKHKIPFWEKSCCVCIVGERNCGKTTSPLNIMMDKAAPNNKILIVRNTEKQLKTQINDFNNRFRNRFQIVGGMIYRMVATTKYNKEIEDYEPIYKRGECVGYAADLNNYHNYKSVEAKDVRMIFMDEIIQLDSIQMFYEKFVNLLMTFARFNRPSIVMLGNRDSVNNEIMVCWEIEPLKEAPKEDVVYEIAENTYYVDLGTEQFKDLYDREDNEPHIVKTLAKFNSVTNSYLNEGGYLVDFSLNVVPFKKTLQATFDPKYLITFGERLAVMGSCLENRYCVVKHPEAVKLAQEQNLVTIPLDATGFLVPDSMLVERDATNKILRNLLMLYKKGELYCDSFELYDWLKQKMSFYCMFE